MKLIYDARPVALEHTGLGRYTASLLLELLESSDPGLCQIEVIVDSTCAQSDNLHVRSIRAAVERRGQGKVHEVPVPGVSIQQQWRLAPWVNRLRADHYFYPHFDLPFGIATKSTFVVHDLLPLKVLGYVQNLPWLKKLYFISMLRSSVRRSARCIAVSRTTRSDLMDLVGWSHAAKIDVAFEGPILSGAWEKPTCMKVESPFLLYVGDRRPHKNIKKVIDLFSALRACDAYAGKLLLVGSTRNFGFDVEMYLAGRDDVVTAGNITDAQLSWCYRHTDALIFLSEYEGFGLPVIEAAVHNRRMVLSDGGALKEIAPPSACVIERSAAIDEAVARVASYLCSSSEVDNTAHVRQFGWNRAARHIFPYAYG